ncbi:MAG: MobF family relaxase [Acidimicrobiales bacterium]|jgi:conjugative relaxase-like TrwC/TraI family protein
MRMMGADSVAYHRETIIGRGDDFPGAALEYYASRGETPLVWGGSGATSLGLSGAVDDPSYDALYGSGGACDPITGRRLVSAKRPGMELVIAAHKSVAELGVLSRAEDMHAIMDAERDATLAYLDARTIERGGRRGTAAVPTETTGLVYAHTRHATTRAGDPGPHDHVLLANVIEMRDTKGGTKAPDTTLWREHLHAATVVGRLASAKVAVDLGYGIEADGGPTGRLGHWRIAGIPDEALAVHSKRSVEIEAAVVERGFSTYQARSVAARDTRKHKRHEDVATLVPMWSAELEAAGFPAGRLSDDISQAGRDYQQHRSLRPTLTNQQLSELATSVLAQDGALSARKVFARRDVIVAVGPALYGRDPVELAKVADRVLRDPEAVALIGVARATERVYATASVLAIETAIADAVARGVQRTDVAVLHPAIVEAAVGYTTRALGAPLTAGQLNAVRSIATSGRQVELIEGVAGSGKTTLMAVVRRAFESGGFIVLGTSTSGQAARTLAREAGLGEARTLASFRWRLDDGRLALSDRHVLVLDEAGMASDRDVAFLLDRARLAGAKVVMVGDDRQLGAIGSGGAMGALVERHGGAVHTLDQNVRQLDERERGALIELRSGEVTKAVDFYLSADRVVVEATRSDALGELAERWTSDVGLGKDAAMFAWRRANVAELNRLARRLMVAQGRVIGPELQAPGGSRYAVGDRIVTLAPGARGEVVTSERGVVLSVDLEQQRLTAQMDDGRRQRFEREEIRAQRLAHGYATTVHRSQGATCDVSHVYEDGGGRELAYVAMSRAREETHLYLAADGLAQAREDLERSWAAERRWRWAIDTGTPEIEHREGASLRRQALVAEYQALAAAVPRDVTAALRQAISERDHAARELDRLRRDQGLRSEGELGKAAGELAMARYHQFRNERDAESKSCTRAIRRDARRAIERHELWVQAAQEKVTRLFAPEERRLTEALEKAEHKVGALSRKDTERSRWFEDQPEVPHRLQTIDNEVSSSEWEVDHERRDVERELNPQLERTYVQEHEHSRSYDHDYDHDIEHDYGFGL